MISLEKWNILSPLQKLPNTEGHLGKIVVATGFKKLPKVQKIVQSGHTSGAASQVVVVLQETHSPFIRSWLKNNRNKCRVRNQT